METKLLFKRHYVIGTVYKNRSMRYPITIDVEIREDKDFPGDMTKGELSICGEVRFPGGGYSAGQNNDTIAELALECQITKYAPGWDRYKVNKLCLLWDKWHLNHMRAGKPEQHAFMREWFKEHPGYSDYHQQCAALENAGLLVVDGYKYGTAWLKEDLPQDVIDWIKAM